MKHIQKDQRSYAGPRRSEGIHPLCISVMRDSLFVQRYISPIPLRLCTLPRMDLTSHNNISFSAPTLSQQPSIVNEGQLLYEAPISLQYPIDLIQGGR